MVEDTIHGGTPSTTSKVSAKVAEESPLKVSSLHEKAQRTSSNVSPFILQSPNVRRGSSRNGLSPEPKGFECDYTSEMVSESGVSSHAYARYHRLSDQNLQLYPYQATGNKESAQLRQTLTDYYPQEVKDYIYGEPINSFDDLIHNLKEGETSCGEDMKSASNYQLQLLNETIQRVKYERKKL